MTSAGAPSATSRPLCSTTMRSASERITSILCSTSRMVRELSPFSVLMRSRITGTSSTLMPAVGSSNISTGVPSAISIATSSLRWSPCGRADTLRSAASTQPHLRQHVVGARVSSACVSAIDSMSKPRLRLGLRDQAHVLAHGEIGKQVGELERAADAAMGALGHARARDVLAVEAHAFRRWP